MKLEKFEASVRDLSDRGLGVIDHPDGRVFFVRSTWPGDRGWFEVSSDAQSYEEAKLIRILENSPDRVEVPCVHRTQVEKPCGGCPWMIASYVSQLSFKVKRLKHVLSKNGVHFDPYLRPVIKAPEIFAYRNRAQFKTDGKRIGYVSEGTHELAPVESCLVLNSKLKSLFKDVKQTLPRRDFEPTEDCIWSFLDLDDEMTLSDLVLNRRRPFKQGNTEQNEVMKRWVCDKLAEVPRHYPLIDLFCGSGNFTELMSELQFEKILAVEVQGVALEKLKLKKLGQVKIFAQDIQEKGAWAKISREQKHAKVMLVDPPRSGLEKRRGFFKYFDQLEKVLYLSCEMDSFARDVKDFIRQGWILEEIQPIDLFPHTPHLEIMSVLRRSSI